MPVYPNNLVEKTGKTKARMIRFCLISYFNNKLFRAEINTVFGGVFVLFCSFTKHVFYLSHRCGPCLRIAPAFSSMSNKYPQAVFLEVDVHQCQVRERSPLKKILHWFEIQHCYRPLFLSAHSTYLNIFKSYTDMNYYNVILVY